MMGLLVLLISVYYFYHNRNNTLFNTCYFRKCPFGQIQQSTILGETTSVSNFYFNRFVILYVRDT